SVPSGLTAGTEPICVKVISPTSRRLLIGAYCRGRLMAHERLALLPNRETQVLVRPNGSAGGVFRVTVFEEESTGDPVRLTPLAERMVYRTSPHQLNVRIDADKKVYGPGDKVGLTYTATDEKGQPAPAVLMVAVVDKSVLKLADEKTFRAMPTH